MSEQQKNGNGENFPQTIEGELISPEIDIVSLAEKSIDRWKKVADLAIKLTTPRDWVNQNGNPYLQHSGAERIGRQFRISLTNVKREKIWSEDEKGERYYIWVYEGDASMPGIGTQHAIGNCSSRDQLFGMVGKELKPFSQIDEPSIMKAAHTNLIVNAITHMLGLRNLTWEQLKPYNITPDSCTKIEYKGGSKGGSEDKNLSSTAQKQRDEIEAMVREMFNGDEKLIEAYYEERTTWNNDKGEKVKGYNLKRWTEKQIYYNYKMIQKKYAEKMGHQFGENPPEK